MLQILRNLYKKLLFSQNTIRYRVEFARLRDAFNAIGPQGEVMDGGAGSGEMLRKLQAEGLCRQGFALEPDDRLYPLLCANIRNRKGLSATKGGLLDIPFPDDRFDCVMSTQVLEHIADHEKAAAELARVVKPGGYLVISVPHPPEPFPNPEHVREGYTESDLRALFPESRFEHLATRYCLTRTTIRKVMAFEKLPLRGMFMPVAMADAETKLNDGQRQADLPFVIMCTFRKRAESKIPVEIGL
jgi:SAM-dependent methyltransferase